MERTDTKKTVLFICTHNAARSQMAKGLSGRYMTIIMKRIVQELNQHESIRVPSE